MDAIKKLLSQLGKDSKKKVTDALQEKVVFSAWDYAKSGEPEFAAARLENLASTLKGVDAIAVKQAVKELRESAADSTEAAAVSSWIADLQDRVATLEAASSKPASRGSKKATAETEE